MGWSLSGNIRGASGAPGQGVSWTIGDGTSTSITVTHGLNTRALTVGVYSTATWEEVECDVVLTSTTSITLTFADPPAVDSLLVTAVSGGTVGPQGPIGLTGATGPPGPTTWEGITDKPTVIAAGMDAAAARTAISAASLDVNGKVPVAELPNSIMQYQGTYNVSTNTPSLADGTGNTGDVYRVSVAGSRNFGSGAISFEVGDYVIYNGSVWEKSDTTDAVSTVAGLTGDVSAVGLRSALGSGTPSSSNFLRGDGTWSSAGISRSVQTITVPTTLSGAANTDYVVFSNQDSYPTSGDPNLSQVVTLLHMDGSSGSTTFTNSAPGKADWTAVGGAQLQTSNKKFGTAAFQEGSGRYLSAPSSLKTDLTFGTDDFTIEGWFYLGQIGMGYDPLFDWRPANDLTNERYFYALYADGGGPGIGWLRGQSVLFINYGSFQNATGWYHVAFARQSGTLRMFVNGSLQGTATDTTDYLASDNPRIGSTLDPIWPRRPFDEIRITKGLARYTTAFSVPTSAFPDSYIIGQNPQITLPTAVGSTNRYTIKNVSSSFSVPVTSSTTVEGSTNGDTNASSNLTLLNFDSGLTCEAPTPKTWTALTGNPTISTLDKKFGTGSLFLGGTSSLTSTSSEYNRGTGDFTIECWIKPANVTTDQVIVATRNTDQTYYGEFGLYVTSGGRLNWYDFHEGFLGGSLSANTWTHVAAAKNGTTLRLFINGTLSATKTHSRDISTTTMRIGSHGEGTYKFSGYIDDFRFSSVCRYVDSFTPPTTAFSTVALGGLVVKPGSVVDLASDGSTWRTV